MYSKVVLLQLYLFTDQYEIKSNQHQINMFNHSIKIVQIQQQNKMYTNKLAQEFDYNTEHSKVDMLPNNKIYKYYFIS